MPALVGSAYAVLLAQGLRARTGGGFGSIAAVRRLFADDAALAAGWLHYIAFDMFVGTWVAHAGLDADMLPPISPTRWTDSNVPAPTSLSVYPTRCIASWNRS